MRRELEEAARDGTQRAGSPVSIGGGVGFGGGGGGGGSNPGSLNDIQGAIAGAGCGAGAYYSEALPNSVHMQFVSFCIFCKFHFFFKLNFF